MANLACRHYKEKEPERERMLYDKRAALPVGGGGGGLGCFGIVVYWWSCKEENMVCGFVPQSCVKLTIYIYSQSLPYLHYLMTTVPWNHISTL